MGKRPSRDTFIPPEVAMFGNRYAAAWQASATTHRTYRSWWQLFFTAAISRFKWEGLPDYVDARWLECALFTCGSVALTRRSGRDADLMPYVAATYATEGKLDAYNNPNRIRMTTANGQQFVRHANKWVRRTGNQHAHRARLMDANACVCWDSIARLPLFNSIDLLCRRLAEIDVTIDQHVRSQRVPFIFVVPEEGRANAEAMFNKVSSGDPAIYLTPTGTGVMNVNCFNTGVDYVADKMLNDELKLVSQGYTLLGVDNNAAAEKKERVQTAETVANNEQFLLQRHACQAARDQFCEDVARVFGLSVRATWSVPHVWDAGEDASYNPALETSSATLTYGVSRGLFTLGGNSGGGGNAGNAL